MTNTVIKAGVATRISDACKLFVCINCTFARRYSRKQNLVVTVCLEIYFCVDRGKKKQQLETNLVVLFSEENTSRLVKGCSVARCQTLISGHPVRKHHLCQTGQHRVCAD